jgi:hypothetical protein
MCLCDIKNLRIFFIFRPLGVTHFSNLYRSTNLYLRSCVPLSMLSKSDYIYWSFLLHFCIQCSLAVSLLPAHKHKIRRCTLLLCVHALEHTIHRGKREQSYSCPFTHWQTHLHFHLSTETSHAPSSQNNYLKKESICLWQNQIHIVNDLKFLFIY